VVDDLAHVTIAPLSSDSHLELEQISQGSLSPLDLRAEYGFLADIHAYEKVRVGQDGSSTLQTTKSYVRV